MDDDISVISITATSGYTGAGANDGHIDNSGLSNNIVTSGDFILDNEEFSLGGGILTVGGNLDVADVATYNKDAGDIILQKTIPLDINMTAEDLYKIITPMGADLVCETLDLFNGDTASPVKQVESNATHCGKIDRDTALIDWNKKSMDIHNLVRGLNPKPCAWTVFKDRNVKIWRTRLTDEHSDGRTALPEKLAGLGPGSLCKFSKGLYVGIRQTAMRSQYA